MPPPKKRERDVDASKMNGHPIEQELFLQAFEKPTQIYRFLRNRHGTSPIFLNRTLSYMKDRMSRNNKNRSTFKVNSILDSISHKTDTVGNYLNIVFNGLFDKSVASQEWWQKDDMVSVETTLYKITKNKRKDSTSDFQEVLTNLSHVVYNPHMNISKFSAISIPMQSLRPLGEQHTIYKVLFRIKILPKFTATKSQDKTVEEDQEEEVLPPAKRIKPNPKILGCELIVFEKNTGCVIAGEYEAALQELSSNSIKCFSPKKKSWESLPDSYIPISLKFDVFNQSPTLKFRLTWSNMEIPSVVDAKEFQLDELKDVADIETNDNGINGDSSLTIIDQSNQINHNNNFIKGSTQATQALQRRTAEDKIQIEYNFIYSNNTRQQTEYTQEVVCPWCGLDCLRLYALLKHLKLCHARFNFTYHPAANGARIDVTINDAYDGSYAGSPYDLAGPSGCSFARTCGPVRRTTVTNLLVCRPRRQKTCLDEFLVLDEDDLQNQRPYITGHNRLYHHTETCLPVHPKELDIDSEGESDPLWLRQKTIQMIDEFTDVNEGEKELMKLWNLHVMKNGYVGDCQLPLACEMFLDAKGHEIIRKNLYRNFILHMSSLFDYGLVSPETLCKTIQKLQGILSKYTEGQRIISESRESQVDYWLKVGIHKQDDQKLKSPQKQPPSSSLSATTDGSKATAPSTAMNPPAKRTTSPMKKACYSQNCYVEVNDIANVIGSGNLSRISGKTVSSVKQATMTTTVGKTASQTVVATATENGVKKGSTTVFNNKDTKTASSSSKTIEAEKKTNSSASLAKPSVVPAGKLTTRRMSLLRDPSSLSLNKRNNSNSTATSTSTNSHHRSTLAPLKTEPPGRITTRRQTISASGPIPGSSNDHHHHANNQPATSHSLRNRLSVPLSRAEKR